MCDYITLEEVGSNTILYHISWLIILKGSNWRQVPFHVIANRVGAKPLSEPMLDYLIWTNFSEILIQIDIFPLTKIHLKMSSGKWGRFCPCLNVFSQKHHLWTIAEYRQIIIRDTMHPICTVGLMSMYKHHTSTQWYANVLFHSDIRCYVYREGKSEIIFWKCLLCLNWDETGVDWFEKVMMVVPSALFFLWSEVFAHYL